MKRAVIFLILFLYIFNFVSAYYQCSDGSTIKDDQKEILLDEKKTINGLSLGLIFADETPSLQKYSAELITDAHRFSFTDNATSFDIEFDEDTETIELLNLTSDEAEIEFDGDSELISEGNSKNLGDYIVFVSKAEGEYLNTTDVEGFTGTEKITLSRDSPTETVSLVNQSYLVELLSASDTNAIIEVKKCTTGEIEEIEDIVNDTVTAEANETVEQNASVNDSVEETQNVINTSGENDEGNISQASEKKSVNIFYILTGVIILVLVVLSFFLIKYLKSDKSETEQNKVI
jgi:hypothetical protein